MIDYFENIPEKLNDSLLELLIARREDTYHKIVDSDREYSKCKEIIEKHINELEKTDPKTAEILIKAIEYVEGRIIVNLYKKGFQDGQELHILASTILNIDK